MKKVMFVLGSVVVFLSGFAFAREQSGQKTEVREVFKPEKIKADVKSIKEVKGLAARNCTGSDCTLADKQFRK